MTGLMLFVRSRRLLLMLVVLALIGAVGVTIEGATHQVFLSGSDATIPWVTVLPLLSAVAIAFSIRSPLHDLDVASARRLDRLRLGQLVVLCAVGVASIALATPHLQDYSSFAGTRNLVGLLGMSLIFGRLVSGSLSWLPATVNVLTALTVGDPHGGALAWDWPIRGDDDFSAFAVAACLGLLGLVLGLGGSRENTGQVEL